MLGRRRAPSQMPWSGSATPRWRRWPGTGPGPEVPGQALAAAGVEQDRVEHRAVDIVLALVEGAVADPHRPGAVVAGEVVAGGLGQVAPAVDAVHDLQPAVVHGLELGHELHELVGLPVQVQVVEGLEGEGRVPHPGVAVVPVALAVGRLRQRGGQGGHGRPGGHVGQALDGQGRALDRLAPAVVGHAGAVEPLAPVADGRRQPRLGVGRSRRRGQPRLGPRQRAEHARPRPARAARRPDRPPGRGPCRWPGGPSRPRRRRPRRAGRRPPAPTRRWCAIVEHGLAHELHLDRPFMQRAMRTSMWSASSSAGGRCAA